MTTRKFIIFIVILACVLLVPIGQLAVKEKVESKEFVTGVYGKFCYKSGCEDGRIKKKIYYSTLSECGKPLKNIC